MELKDLPKPVTQPRGAYAQVGTSHLDKEPIVDPEDIERRKRLRVAEAPVLKEDDDA